MLNEKRCCLNSVAESNIVLKRLFQLSFSLSLVSHSLMHRNTILKVEGNYLDETVFAVGATYQGFAANQ